MSENRENRKLEKPVYETDELFSNSDDSEPPFGEISESKKNNSSYLNHPSGTLVLAPSSGKSRKSQPPDFTQRIELDAKPALSRSSISNSVAITIS